MADGIYTALSGAIAQQRSLDVVANNVANANTTGFRGDRVAFEQSLADAVGPTTGPDDTRYVAISSVRTDDSAGALEQTGGALDIAIQGDGFFQVRTPAGDRFTRAGNFVTDGDGVLRTNAGHAVLAPPPTPDEPPTEIVIPREATEVLIGADGMIEADGEEVGRIRVAHFERPDAVQKEGLTLFTSNATPSDEGSSTLVQGALERANVNAVAGMNELITVSRSYDAFQKVIQGFRQIDERTARELGRRS